MSAYQLNIAYWAFQLTSRTSSAYTKTGDGMLLWHLLLAAVLVIPAIGFPIISTRDTAVPSFSTLIPIPDITLQLVKENTRSISQQTWELGTMAEAYLEIGTRQSKRTAAPESAVN